MSVVALPGRRSETEPWLRALLDASGHPDARVVRYRHWDTAHEASVAVEAERLADAAPRIVVAKSFGTIVAATAYDAWRFRPAYGLFVGTPYAAIDDDALHLLRRFAAEVTTLFIQQAEDPGGAASALAATLRLRRGEVVEVPGSDHLYRDVDALAAIVRRWPGPSGGA